MNRTLRVLTAALCAALVLAMPFFLSSPAMLGEVKWQLLEEMEDEAGALSWLLPTALAEEASADETIPDYTLPIDFTPGYAPDPSGYTDAGYEDDSIRVQMETREENGVIWRIAWVEVASATQLRTATAGKLTSSNTARVKSMAVKNNAVVALNGDYFADNPTKTSFEYRMGQKVREKINKLKDILIIDENGDFHMFIQSQGLSKQNPADTWEKETGHQIMQAFTFGPALVQGGEVLTINKDYGYNPKGREPRSAIGQTGTLSYVLVVAEGRGESKGVTQQELAEFMGGLGCLEAYNLDGGGTAAMVYQGEYYNTLAGSERAVSDIIYFASAVNPEGGN